MVSILQSTPTSGKTNFVKYLAQCVTSCSVINLLYEYAIFDRRENQNYDFISDNIFQ